MKKEASVSSIKYYAKWRDKVANSSHPSMIGIRNSSFYKEGERGFKEHLKKRASEKSSEKAEELLKKFSAVNTDEVGAASLGPNTQFYKPLQQTQQLKLKGLDIINKSGTPVLSHQQKKRKILAQNAENQTLNQ